VGEDEDVLHEGRRAAGGSRGGPSKPVSAPIRSRRCRRGT
jgi:hypothetical protein